MRISSQNSSFLASISLIVLFIFVASPSAARFSPEATNQVDIKQLCSKATNPSFCLTFLSSAPGVATAADLPTLCKISVNSAIASATSTVNLIKSLLGKPEPNDPGLKERLTSCSEHYDDIMENLQEALASLTGGGVGGPTYSVSAALDDADECREEIGSYQSVVSKNSQDLENMCSVILTIANQIPH